MLPSLEWDVSSWTGTLVVPAWAGFSSRNGRYNARDREAPSDGRARLRIHSATERALPTRAQQAAILGLDAAARAVIAAIAARYPQWRTDSMLDDELLDEIMPELETPEHLRELMGIGWIHVLDVEKDGLAYVGFEVGATWEEEHSVGVLTHATRIVRIGQADAAFSTPHADLKET